MIKRDLTKPKSTFSPSQSKTHNPKSIIYSKAFTIVELLVVIVVIGILAAITIVAYVGVNQKAVASSLQSDLTGASRQLELYKVDHGQYPTDMVETPADSGIYCPTGPEDPRYCVKTSSGNEFVYASPSPYSTYTLDATQTSSATTYSITNSTGPVLGSSIPPEPPIPTVTIGTQTWMQYNLDVGTRIDGATAQANNSTVEKWCYNNDPNNCTTYGGLYQWDEMMEYTTTEGIQGICPDDFHLPTNAEYTTLTTYLGGEPVAGEKMQSGGTSGFNGLLGGRNIYLSWANFGGSGFFWSSTSNGGPSGWSRDLYLSYAPVTSSATDAAYGFSVRCLKD